MFRGGDQTQKVDVYSLFVTMLWVFDAGELCQGSKEFKTFAQVHRAVSSAASNVDSVSKIREMVIINPEERASAAQMIVKYFSGVGLSTPGKQVPPLTPCPSPTSFATRAPPPVYTSLTTRSARTKSKVLRTNENVFAVAQYRVEKSRGLQAKPRLQD